MKYPINIQKVEQSRIGEVDFDNIPFGRIFSDHMFISEYEDGWRNFRIVPFQTLKLHPAISAIHYGQSIFEGLKAHRNIHTGAPQIFRPDMNAKRFHRSAERMAIPPVPEDLFLQAVSELVSIDRQWIPEREDHALYIRPFIFATDEYIGIKPSDNYLFVIFTCPVGAYYPRPVRVLVSDKYVRAFPGGVGIAKAAGNYAATMKAVNEARQMGFDQILWMDGIEFKYVQEIGTMNVFFIIDGTVITPSLDEGTILAGVTRDSVIRILKDRGIPVEERRVSIDEVVDAYRKGRLEDAFGTGTAATVSHISHIGYKGEVLELPPSEEREISNMLRQTLNDIKISRIPDPYGWVYKLEDISVESTQ